MNKLFSLQCGIIFSITLGLVGCGGGGGGSSPKPNPTTSTPALSSSSSIQSSSSLPSSSSLSSSSSSSSSSVPSSSSASLVSSSSSVSSSLSSASIASSSSVAKAQLTIRGTAVAEGLAGGEISVAVGSRTYKTQINNKNQYEITLDIESTTSSQPFAGVATGAASNRWIQLAALFPSLNKLKTLAGEDGVLDANEYLGVNFSPVTTAEYSLVLGNHAFPATDELRQHALVTIDAVDQLKRAAYLQRVLTDIDTELPAQFPATLSMMADDKYISSRINILKAYEDALEDEVTFVLKDADQTRVSNKPLSGKFLVSGAGFYYLLEFNDNGKGYLLTSNSPGRSIWSENAKSRESAFTWVKKGAEVKITPDAPINYGKSSGSTDCIQFSGSSATTCQIQVNAIFLSLLSENEVAKIADISLDISLTIAGTQNSMNSIVGNHFATLLDRSKLHKVTAAELQSYEWYTDTARYFFSSGNTATQTSLITKTDKNVTWQLNDGLLTLSGDTKLLLPLYPTEYGFKAIELREQSNQIQLNNALQQTMMVKRENVVMKTSDWVGRWQRVLDNSFTAAFDYYVDGGYRDGFDIKAYGTWSAVSSSRLSGLAGGTWRMDHEVLAIHAGKHYIKYCYGPDSSSFVPVGCLVEPYVFDKTFTGNIFWDTWSRPFFQEAGTQREWRFAGHDLALGSDNFYRAHQRVGYNLLLNKFTNKLLELRSSDLNSVEVCEYDPFSSCDKGTVYRLNRGLEIAVNSAGGGSVTNVSGGVNVTVYGKGSMLLPKSKVLTLNVSPSSGYSFSPNNISGCGGAMVGGNYEIPARTTDCEITVSFIKQP